jgi:glutaredoxin
MMPRLTLYSRQACCLCDEMKAVITQVAVTIPFEMEEIDIDGDAVLRARYNDEVPVLFIDGRKAFKYRATVVELIRKLKRKRRPFLTRVARLVGKDLP